MLWLVPLLAFLAVSLPQDPRGVEPPLGRTRPAPLATTGTSAALRAAVVKSWDRGRASAWGQLNLEWQLYGPVPIEIDASLGNGPITHAGLVATGAVVVILSDPAGGNQQYSPTEIADLTQYVEEGHNLVGTYLTFYWNGGLVEIDNRALAPLFGFAPGLSFHPQPIAPAISNRFRVLQSSTILRGLPLTSTDPLHGSTWTSLGYPYTQTQADRRWDPEDLGAARAVAQCDGRTGILSAYDAPTYSAVYVSNMPEYFGGPNEKQLLYNAITYKHPLQRASARQ